MNTPRTLLFLFIYILTLPILVGRCYSISILRVLTPILWGRSNFYIFNNVCTSEWPRGRTLLFTWLEYQTYCVTCSSKVILHLVGCLGQLLGHTNNLAAVQRVVLIFMSQWHHLWLPRALFYSRSWSIKLTIVLVVVRVYSTRGKVLIKTWAYHKFCHSDTTRDCLMSSVNSWVLLDAWLIILSLPWD